MPLRRVGSGRFYVTLTYKGKQLKLFAHFYHLGNAKEYWYFQGKNGVVAINYHVQTKEIKQEFANSTEKAPQDFLDAIKAELDARK